MDRFKYILLVFFAVAVTAAASGVLCMMPDSVDVAVSDTVPDSSDPLRVGSLAAGGVLFDVGSGNPLVVSPSNVLRHVTSDFSARLQYDGGKVNRQIRVIGVGRPLDVSHSRISYYIYALHHMRN